MMMRRLLTTSAPVLRRTASAITSKAPLTITAASNATSGSNTHVQTLPNTVVRQYASHPPPGRKKGKKKIHVDPLQYADATPELFGKHSSNDYIVRVNVASMGKKHLPPVPEIDYRNLSNAEWIAKGRKNLMIDLLQKIELYPELFPEQTGFLSAIDKSLSINLSVQYGDRTYYESSLMGNFLEAKQVQDKPVVQFPADSIDKNSYYTFIMLTPDHPFRLEPEGEFLHWMITNIPGNNVEKGETVVDYLPPIPTEYAGTFRYVFLLFKQRSGKINVNKWIKATREEVFGDNQLSANDATSADDHKLTPGGVVFGQRRRFDLEGFADAYDLGSNPEEDGIGGLPQGMSFFRTEYDFCVTEQYQKLGITEPYYIPPDIIGRMAAKEKKIAKDRYTWF